MRSVALVALVGFAATLAGADLQRDFEDGRAAYREGRYDEAAALFLACLDQDPQSELIGTWAGTALLQAGRPREALEVLQRVVSAHPTSAVAHNNLGLAWEALGASDVTVMSQYEKALAHDPGFHEAMHNLARYLIQRGEPERAAAVWRQRIAAEPGDARAHAGLAIVLEATGRYVEALAEVQAALGPRGTDARLRAQMARLRVLSGDLDGGLSDFDLLELEGSLRPEDTEAFALALLAAGRNRRALEILEDPQTRPHLTARGLAGLAEALRAAERWEAMRSALSELVADRTFPRWAVEDQARIHGQLAWLANQSGDAQAARASALRALDLDPYEPVAKSVLEALGEPATSLVPLERAILSGSATLGRVRAYIEQAAARSGYIAPEAVLDALRGTGSDDTDLLLRLGVLFLRSKRAEDAMALFGRAAELAPESAMPRNNLGLAYEALGRPDDAAEQYALAIRLDPECAPARENLRRLRGAGSG